MTSRSKGSARTRQCPLDAVSLLLSISADARSSDDVIGSKGGHDSRFTGNIVYHGHNDGQNCVNTWPFLPEHGAVWENNTCILPRSTNLFGSIASCNCPGKGTITPFDPAHPDVNPQNGECGVSFGNNKYFTHNGTATCNRCGDFETKWKAQNEPDSTVSELPTDEEIIAWARAKLNM